MEILTKIKEFLNESRVFIKKIRFFEKKKLSNNLIEIESFCL